MNFTREPIIETIITPRDGCRLIIRSSKQGSEEFAVDAVEVVSFGQALFFRSLERPRPFLVPVSDYEVLEAKENRVVLKNAQFERTIKIGGGREGSLRKEDEEEDQALPIALEDEVADESDTGPSSDNKKRDRHRRRNRRRPHEEQHEMKHRPEEQAASPEAKPEAPKEAQPSAPFPNLIPPPTTLISHNIHRYKEYQTNSNSETPKPPEEPTTAPPEPEGDSTPISRVAVENQPITTNFTSLNDWSNFLT